MSALVVGLGGALRREVLPELGRRAGRAHAPAGAGGDVTFAIDERAERRLEEYLGEHAPEVAFYSEDRGLLAAGGEPEWVLVVDPIDGTRPAMAGFEAACVSIAAARWAEGAPTMADVEVGLVVEIKSGARFLATRGQGVSLTTIGGGAEGPALEPALSTTTELELMLWAYGLRGRPMLSTAVVLEELIDASSVSGGTFDLGSATFDMTRIVTGQTDAYIDPGPRMIDEVEGMRAEFERVGHGAVLNNSPYDLAAAALILEEAGAVVTDACGRRLDRRPLLGSGHSFQMSCVAAANRELHVRIIAALDRGIGRLERRRSVG